MRTPSQVFPEKRVVYACELEVCPSCGRPLSGRAYRSAPKVVQTLTEALEVAHQPRTCGNPACASYLQVVRSARWLQLAPVNATYGFDVIAQIGWRRQTGKETFAEVLAGLSERVRISESEVRHLYHERYLPLVTCHERERLDLLRAMAERSGLLLALDGLAPEGGEPQLWVVREIQTGLTLRSGWLGKQDEAAFVGFLQPIADCGLRVAAVLSDKQRGLVPAVGVVFPGVPHAFCQVHYLQNASAGVADAAEEMKLTLRQNVRERIGPLIREERAAEAPGVLTVTGLIPSPLPTTPVDEPRREQAAGLPDEDNAPEGELPEDAPATSNDEGGQADDVEAARERERESIVQDVLRRVRYLLTLKARPPFGLAGLEMFERLSEVLGCVEQLHAYQQDARLAELHEGLRQALDAAREDYTLLRQVADWLQGISELLDPQGKSARTGEEVRTGLWLYLDKIREESLASPRLVAFGDSIRKVTASYDPGLFHTYDVPCLPRTNNGRESEFRELNRRLLRTTGQKGLTRRIIQREGAWELIPRPARLEDTITALSRVPQDAFLAERERVRNHRRRFRMHVRSAKQGRAQLEDIVKRWNRLPQDKGS